jgi:hypothetical protein
MIPKSFLQLRGISVANYNMGCHFNIGTAIRLMMQNDLFILAIQEHTPWSRKLSDAEIKLIHRTCDKYQFCAIISKVQMILIDKQIATSIRDTNIYEEGGMIQIRMEILHGKYANFCAMYGYPHSSNNRRDTNSNTQDESSILQGMRQIQKLIKSAIGKAKNAGKLLCIFGDLQDTPDRSKLFYYGTNNIIKHPLGVVQTCEENGLQCTIYKHLESSNKPIISRH